MIQSTRDMIGGGGRANSLMISGLALAVCLAVGSVQAADLGPRPHAQGHYDTVTATYLVTEGDDLFAISERFAVPVEALKADNKRSTNDVKPGEKLAVAPAAGSKPSAAHKSATHKPLAKLTCEDFVGLDERFQPKAIYWAAAYGKNGEPEGDILDVEGIETVVPVIVAECRKAPKESFWGRVKAEFKKIEKKL